MPQRYVENERDENIIYEKMENLETRENSIRKNKKKMAKTVAKNDKTVRDEFLKKESRNGKKGAIHFGLRTKMERINMFMPMIYRNCDKKKKEFR